MKPGLAEPAGWAMLTRQVSDQRLRGRGTWRSSGSGSRCGGSRISGFITGSGRYTDDIELPGQVYGCVVRSPEAHARIAAIDAEAAKAAPGVLAVITGADLEAAGAATRLPCVIPMENRDGSQGVNPPRPVLCTERVRHVGDTVAFVVAETLAQAKDAAELVDGRLRQRCRRSPTPTSAAAAGQPLVHDDVPGQPALRLGVRRARARSRRRSPGRRT